MRIKKLTKILLVDFFYYFFRRLRQFDEKKIAELQHITQHKMQIKKIRQNVAGNSFFCSFFRRLRQFDEKKNR